MPFIALCRTVEDGAIASFHTRLLYLGTSILFAIIPLGIWAYGAAQHEPVVFEQWLTRQEIRLWPTTVDFSNLIHVLKLISWTAFSRMAFCDLYPGQSHRALAGRKILVAHRGVRNYCSTDVYFRQGQCGSRNFAYVTVSHSSAPTVSMRCPPVYRVCWAGFQYWYLH